MNYDEWDAKLSFHLPDANVDWWKNNDSNFVVTIGNDVIEIVPIFSAWYKFFNNLSNKLVRSNVR